MDATTDSSGKITTIDQLRGLVGEPNPRTKLKILDHLDEQARAFVAASPLLLLSTASGEGDIEVSPKGDLPGFVRVENNRTILIPDRPGNNLALGLRNILVNPHVEIIFLLPATGETLRISGRAEILSDPELRERLSAKGAPAIVVIRVGIERAYFHCARALLRSRLWKTKSWPSPGKVSFGAIIAPRMNADENVARAIDENVDKAYKAEL